MSGIPDRGVAPDEAGAGLLEQAYGQIAATLDSLDIGVCVFDAEDRSRIWNRSFLAIFPEHDGKVYAGEPYVENLRRFYLKRLPATEMADIELRIADGIRRHHEQARPFVFFHDGQWLRVSSLPLPMGARIRVWMRIPNPDSNIAIPAGADQASLDKLANAVTYSSHGDIAAVKRQEMLIDQAREAAERANQAKTTFLAMMSHELRTPMHGIIGMAELLLAGTLDEKQRACADLLRSSAVGLMAILNDILDVSHLEVGKVTLQSLEFRPAELIAEVERLVLPGARQAGLYLDVEADPALGGTYLSDPSRLRQVLLVLATNAVKFTKRGGVSITARLKDEARLRIEVRDTGIGFEEGLLDRLFKPFEQAEMGPTRSFGGVGLGLAISGQLVELMGGSIGARSMPGVGSLFWFEVPLQRARGTIPVGPAAVTDGTTAKARILLVEDGGTSEPLARELLEAAGYEMDVAGDGAAALSLVQARRPDLVLTDTHLPDMYGFVLAALLRDRFAELPILALTDPEIANAGDSGPIEGFNDHLSKPFNKRALLTKLQAWLPSSLPAA